MADGLEKQGLIRKSFPVRLWARMKGYETHIKAGEYLLSSRLKPAEILDILRRGSVITYTVTIPEGFTMGQIAALLEEKGLVDRGDFLARVRDAQAAKEYGFSGASLEGYLFPDTYSFSRGLPVDMVIDAMVGRFRKMIGSLKETIVASGIPLEEVITLASIVEKETGVPEERPLIAGVFLNRLKRGMRLESDPTVIYGIDHFDGNLTHMDLCRPTPFNTYVIAGLPPGPIASPGLEAIKAVLHPAETDFLYFVSKNDGTHHFSRTFAEHCRAVETYQKKGRPANRKMS